MKNDDVNGRDVAAGGCLEALPTRWTRELGKDGRTSWGPESNVMENFGYGYGWLPYSAVFLVLLTWNAVIAAQVSNRSR